MATAPGPNPPPPLAVPDSLPAWPPYTQDSNTAELQVAQGHRDGGYRVRGDSEHTQGWGQCEYHLPPVGHPGIALTTPAEPGDPHGLGKGNNGTICLLSPSDSLFRRHSSKPLTTCYLSLQATHYSAAAAHGHKHLRVARGSQPQPGFYL